MNSEWPWNDNLENSLKKILNNNEDLAEDKKDEHYRKAINILISHRNEDEFYKLIDTCIREWTQKVSGTIITFKDCVLLAHSLHYKSPGFGRWFRWRKITEEGKNIFEDDITLLEIFEEKYLQIPQKLNVSLNNEDPSIFNNEVILVTKDGEDKIRINNDKIELPIKTLNNINDHVLKKNHIDKLIALGRKLITQKNDDENSRNKIICKLEEYFAIGEGMQLNVMRLLLSGYIIFRCSKQIEELLRKKNNKNELVIIFFPLTGFVSALEKEGSWLIFLSIPCKKLKNGEFTNTIKNDVKPLILKWWSLIRGHDINATINIKHRYWSLELTRLMSEVVFINEELVWKENETAKQIIGTIGDNVDKNKKIEDQEWDKEVIKNLKEVKGQNEQFREFLSKIKKTAESGKNKVTSIFLYSEPGTGKEMISYLIHLWSRANFVSWQSEKTINLFNAYKEDKKKLWKHFKDSNKNTLETCLLYNNDECPYDKAISVKELINEEVKNGYFAINCALLDKDNFSNLSFGTLQKPDGILKVNQYAGTCFFDEFNTIQKGVENNFLRLLEDPYEALIKNDNSKDAYQSVIKDFNCMFVFASNKKPDELVNEGYNSAVITRISKNYFEVPPLRERREDMLLAFIAGLADRKKDVGWETIEYSALQFICLLPWKGNYRALKGFVADLSNERSHNGITAKEISFQEIVECAVRRKLIGE